MTAIEAACYWMARRLPRAVMPLEGHVEAAVVVVGAGLTGLWTAIALKELDPALTVAVLQAEVAAYGASGRNAGILTETVDHSHGLAVEHFGVAEARRLARFGEEKVAAMRGGAGRRGRARADARRNRRGATRDPGDQRLHPSPAASAHPSLHPALRLILVSDPVTPGQREAIGWHRRQGVTDGRSFFNYYRLTRDDRVLWGTSEAVYYRGNRVDRSCDHSARHYADLGRSFRRQPFFGRALGGRVSYGLGYTGHGLGTTRLAGRILAHLALDRPDELLNLALVRRPPFPYPPEPFRSWSFRAVTRALRRVDEGGSPGLLLRLLERVGIGFSS